MELTKRSRQRIIVLADERQHTADPVHGRQLLCQVAGSASAGRWLG